jgi:hypothetical protein
VEPFTDWLWSVSGVERFEFVESGSSGLRKGDDIDGAPHDGEAKQTTIESMASRLRSGALTNTTAKIRSVVTPRLLPLPKKVRY